MDECMTGVLKDAEQQLLSRVSGLESICSVGVEPGGSTFGVEGGGVDEEWSMSKLETVASIEATRCKRSL